VSTSLPNRILIDTDVLLDVALNRRPYVEDSAEVLRWAEKGGAACVAWHSLSNCAYLLANDGREFLATLLDLVDVAPTSRQEAQSALHFPMKDLEDALQAEAALAWKAEYVITRNLKDYRHSPVPALSPPQFIAQLS
jgi:predicted nucleic acid-binding protein